MNPIYKKFDGLINTLRESNGKLVGGRRINNLGHMTKTMIYYKNLLDQSLVSFYDTPNYYNHIASRLKNIQRNIGDKNGALLNDAFYQINNHTINTNANLLGGAGSTQQDVASMNDSLNKSLEDMKIASINNKFINTKLEAMKKRLNDVMQDGEKLYILRSKIEWLVNKLEQLGEDGQAAQLDLEKVKATIKTITDTIGAENANYTSIVGQIIDLEKYIANIEEFLKSSEKTTGKTDTKVMGEMNADTAMNAIDQVKKGGASGYSIYNQFGGLSNIAETYAKNLEDNLNKLNNNRFNSGDAKKLISYLDSGILVNLFGVDSVSAIIQNVNKSSDPAKTYGDLVTMYSMYNNCLFLKSIVTGTKDAQADASKIIDVNFLNDDRYKSFMLSIWEATFSKKKTDFYEKLFVKNFGTMDIECTKLKVSDSEFNKQIENYQSHFNEYFIYWTCFYYVMTLFLLIINNFSTPKDVLDENIKKCFNIGRNLSKGNFFTFLKFSKTYDKSSHDTSKKLTFEESKKTLREKQIEFKSKFVNFLNRIANPEANSEIDFNKISVDAIPGVLDIISKIFTDESIKSELSSFASMNDEIIQLKQDLLSGNKKSAKAKRNDLIKKLEQQKEELKNVDAGRTFDNLKVVYDVFSTLYPPAEGDSTKDAIDAISDQSAKDQIIFDIGKLKDLLIAILQKISNEKTDSDIKALFGGLRDLYTIDGADLRLKIDTDAMIAKINSASSLTGGAPPGTASTDSGTASTDSGTASTGAETEAKTKTASTGAETEAKTGTASTGAKTGAKTGPIIVETGNTSVDAVFTTENINTEEGLTNILNTLTIDKDKDNAIKNIIKFVEDNNSTIPDKQLLCKLILKKMVNIPELNAVDESYLGLELKSVIGISKSYIEIDNLVNEYDVLTKKINDFKIMANTSADSRTDKSETITEAGTAPDATKTTPGAGTAPDATGTAPGNTGTSSGGSRRGRTKYIQIGGGDKKKAILLKNLVEQILLLITQNIKKLFINKKIDQLAEQIETETRKINIESTTSNNNKDPNIIVHLEELYNGLVADVDIFNELKAHWNISVDTASTQKTSSMIKINAEKNKYIEFIKSVNPLEFNGFSGVFGKIVDESINKIGEMGNNFGELLRVLRNFLFPNEEIDRVNYIKKELEKFRRIRDSSDSIEDAKVIAKSNILDLEAELKEISQEINNLDDIMTILVKSINAGSSTSGQTGGGYNIVRFKKNRANKFIQFGGEGKIEKKRLKLILDELKNAYRTVQRLQPNIGKIIEYLNDNRVKLKDISKSKSDKISETVAIEHIKSGILQLDKYVRRLDAYLGTSGAEKEKQMGTEIKNKIIDVIKKTKSDYLTDGQIPRSDPQLTDLSVDLMTIENPIRHLVTYLESKNNVLRYEKEDFAALNNVQTFDEFNVNVIMYDLLYTINKSQSDIDRIINITAKLELVYKTAQQNYIKSIPMIFFVIEYPPSRYKRDKESYFKFSQSENTPYSIEYKFEKNNMPDDEVNKFNEFIKEDFKFEQDSVVNYTGVFNGSHMGFFESSNNLSTQNLIDDPMIGLTNIIAACGGNGITEPLSRTKNIMFALGASGTGKTTRYFGVKSTNVGDQKGIVPSLIESSSSEGKNKDVYFAYFVCYGRSVPDSNSNEFKELVYFYNFKSGNNKPDWKKDKNAELQKNVEQFDEKDEFGINAEGSKYSSNILAYTMDDSTGTANTYSEFYTSIMNKKLKKLKSDETVKFFKGNEKFPSFEGLEYGNFRELILKNEDIWINTSDIDLTNVFEHLLVFQKLIFTVMPTRNNIESSRGHTCILIKFRDAESADEKIDKQNLDKLTKNRSRTPEEDTALAELQRKCDETKYRLDKTNKYFPLFDMAGTEKIKGVNDAISFPSVNIDDSETKEKNKFNLAKLLISINRMTNKLEINKDAYGSLKDIFDDKIGRKSINGFDKLDDSIVMSGGADTSVQLNENISRLKASFDNTTKKNYIDLLNKIPSEGRYINHTIAMLIFISMCVGFTLDSQCSIDNRGKITKDMFDNILTNKYIDVSNGGVKDTISERGLCKLEKSADSQLLSKEITGNKPCELDTAYMLQDLTYNDILSKNCIWAQILLSFLYWNELTEEYCNTWINTYDKEKSKDKNLFLSRFFTNNDDIFLKYEKEFNAKRLKDVDNLINTIVTPIDARIKSQIMNEVVYLKMLYAPATGIGFGNNTVIMYAFGFYYDESLSLPRCMIVLTPKYVEGDVNITAQTIKYNDGIPQPIPSTRFELSLRTNDNSLDIVKNNLPDLESHIINYYKYISDNKYIYYWLTLFGAAYFERISKSTVQPKTWEAYNKILEDLTNILTKNQSMPTPDPSTGKYHHDEQYLQTEYDAKINLPEPPEEFVKAYNWLKNVAKIEIDQVTGLLSINGEDAITVLKNEFNPDGSVLIDGTNKLKKIFVNIETNKTSISSDNGYTNFWITKIKFKNNKFYEELGKKLNAAFKSSDNVITDILKLNHFSKNSENLINLENLSSLDRETRLADLKITIDSEKNVTCSYVNKELETKKNMYRSIIEYNTNKISDDKTQKELDQSISIETELTKRAFSLPTKMTLMHLVTGQTSKAKMVKGTCDLVETIWKAVEVKPSES